MRKLKHHERKLLRKADFLNYDVNGHSSKHEAKIVEKFRLSGRSEYKQYNNVANLIKKIAHGLKRLDEKDEFRYKSTKVLLKRLKDLGLLKEGDSLVELEKFGVSQFAHRRLATIVKNLKMANHLEHAQQLVETGHITVAGKVVTDPAYLVSVRHQDTITWAHSSKIRQIIDNYKGDGDDFNNELI